MVDIEDLSLAYPGAAQAAVLGVGLRVARGEFLTLLGPSGCGKTSTLRSIAGLETPTGGRIAIGGQAVFDHARGIDVPTHARDIAMVFQSYAIWPHMSVAQNVAFPLEVAGRPRAEVRARVREALDMVGLHDLLERSATQLSGGQQQRVAIARALVRGAAVMLLDEPLSNLDAKLREQMRIELRELLKRVGMTAVYVTHDQEEALMLSDRVALMRGGRLVEIGTPRELYLRPTTAFAATFLGAAEILAVLGVDGGRVRTPLGLLAVEGPVTEAVGSLAIRPESVVVRTRDEAVQGRPNCFDGRLLDAVFAGRHQQLALASDGGHRLSALVDATRPLAPGQAVQIELPPHRLIVLGKEPQ
jgi:iron(III) transport system ATP-binding protein